jgi:predicted nucleic acid-binding protein
MIMRERSKSKNVANTEAFLGLLATLPISLDHAPDEPEVLRLARAHKLTVYDSTYLELAGRHGIPLATLDADLVRAARAESIALFRDKK